MSEPANGPLDIYADLDQAGNWRFKVRGPPCTHKFSAAIKDMGTQTETTFLPGSDPISKRGKVRETISNILGKAKNKLKKID